MQGDEIVFSFRTRRRKDRKVQSIAFTFRLSALMTEASGIVMYIGSLPG